MQLEEFQDLRLSKKQYDRLARTILDRHSQKEKQERRDLEAKAKTYSVQDLQEALAGTDGGISEEEVREVVKEKFGKNSEVLQTIRKINPIWYGACAATTGTCSLVNFFLYTSNGRKESLILGLATLGFTLYDSLMAYKSYKKLQN